MTDGYGLDAGGEVQGRFAAVRRCLGVTLERQRSGPLLDAFRRKVAG